jgi:Mn-dependent DtxR family transcriptional regulator
MLRNILEIIGRDGYLSRTQLATELKVDKGVIDEGINQLIRMGYLIEEETGEHCQTSCSNCPFAKNCGKEIVKMFRISDKGKGYLNR